LTKKKKNYRIVYSIFLCKTIKTEDNRRTDHLPTTSAYRNAYYQHLFFNILVDG